MPTGKLELTPAEIQAHLTQMLRKDYDFTPEERYSLRAAGEVIGFLKKLAPHFGTALKQMREKQGRA